MHVAVAVMRYKITTIIGKLKKRKERRTEKEETGTAQPEEAVNHVIGRRT